MTTIAVVASPKNPKEDWIVLDAQLGLSRKELGIELAITWCASSRAQSQGQQE